MQYSSTDISSYLGLSLEHYNFLMALTGSFVGFTFLFFSCYIAINIGSK